jgi:hypothetical protein
MNNVLIPRYKSSIPTEDKNSNRGLEKIVRWKAKILIVKGLEKIVRCQSGPPMLVGPGLLQDF